MGDAHQRARAGDVDAGEQPCLKPACRCCQLWIEALQRLSDQIQRHVAGELRIAPCDDECTVCAQIDWQGRMTAEPAGG